MRILLAVPQGVSDIGDACAQALTQLGHQARRCYYLRGYRQRPSLWDRVAQRVKTRYPALAPAIDALPIAQANRSLLRAAAEWDPELLLVIKGEVFFPRTLARLKKPHRLLVNWVIDDPFRFDNIVGAHLSYDLFFCFDSFYIPRLKEEGAEVVKYLPLAYDHQVCKRIALSHREREEYGNDLSFVGAAYLRRVRLLERLADFDLGIWGAGWESLSRGSRLRVKLRGSAWGRKMVKIYNASKIALNVNHYQSVFGANTRTFEIPGCGAFGLMDMKQELCNLFELGREMVSYRDVDELVEQVRYYLSHDQEREAIAQRGHDRALRDHTYLERMKNLLASL